MDYIPEKDLVNQSKSITIEQMKNLIELCEKRICKIKCNDGSHGTGFFCSLSIDDWNSIKVLITNNHVLSKNDIIQGQKIKLSLNNERINLEILIDESRRIYTSEKYDITIIEINKDDGLKNDSFFEIDNKIFNEDSSILFSKRPVHLLHYAKGVEMNFSSGIIKNIGDDGYSIEHLCDSREGSSGGPIINSTNFQIIAIHKGGAVKAKNYNLGTFLKQPLEIFIKEIKSNPKFIQKKEINKNNNIENIEKNFKVNIYMNEKISEDNGFKIVLGGDTNAGKTSYFERLMEHKYDENTPCTLGLDFSKINLEIKNLKICFTIFDTTSWVGVHNGLIKFCLKESNGILLLFS